MKTIQELNEKMWYRFIKAIYILTSLSIILGVIYGIIIYGLEDDILSILILLVILELFRRIFYYTVLGKIFPSKN